jgi:small redox-active disulfide protein 2
MKIKILGTGCPKCTATEEIVKKVLDKHGIKAEVKHVYDVNKIAEYGVMMTPAVVINGRVKCSGRMPEKKEIEKWLEELTR